MGSKTVISQPSPPPAAPSGSDSMAEFVKYYPELVALEQQYSPEMAQLQLKLLQDYGAPIAQASRDVAKAISPETVALQEKLASVASEGMDAGLTPEMESYYNDIFNANLGQNTGSPIGADYKSRAMLNQLFEQKKYYNDLGLSISGRQPVSAFSGQGMTTPGQQVGMGMQMFPNQLAADSARYGAYSNAWANQPTLARQSGFGAGDAASLMGAAGAMTYGLSGGTGLAGLAALM